MRVRALDGNGDMRFGHNGADFIANSPAAVAQRATTRLGLWQGQWAFDTLDGTPYRTAILGKRVNATRDPTIRARILGTPGAVALPAYASQIARATRAYTVQATLATSYGQTIVATPVTAPNGDVRSVR